MLLPARQHIVLAGHTVSPGRPTVCCLSLDQLRSYFHYLPTMVFRKRASHHFVILCPCLAGQQCVAWPAKSVLPGRPTGHNSWLVGSHSNLTGQFFGLSWPEYMAASAIAFVFVGHINVPATGRWNSRIPRVPGIRPARHTVPVPGMEAVGTM